MKIDAPPAAAVRAAWSELAAHRDQVAPLHLRELFARDAERGARLASEAAGIYFDYSKNRITDQTLTLLVGLANACRLQDRIGAMFRGDRINVTENRAALHVALRADRSETIRVDGKNVVPDVHRVLDRMAAFANAVRDGQWTGATGRPIRTVIHIGIGGSDLGPVMAYQALRHYAARELAVRFVANVDGTDLAEALQSVDAAETLFIVSSKSFTTLETMTNARAARAWLLGSLGGGERTVARHFVAVSTNRAAVEEFGIAAEQMFPFWDWVGGRYSLASAIGLSTIIAIGPEHFQSMLAGMRAIDHHFAGTPLERNLPVIHGLLAVWNADFLGAHTQAVLPYDHYLRRFPAYLQQLTMESNGKRVTTDGVPVSAGTAPIVWGEPGTNGQHSFFQLLHQGTRLVPCDFIAAAVPLDRRVDQHDLLLGNMFAQSEALAFGRTEAEIAADGSPAWLAPHRASPGNRPSNVLLLDRLTPFTLGALVAFYEHSVFTQGAIWGIDSFDQWGVELGKRLAERIVPELKAPGVHARALDSSTVALIARYRRLNG